MMTGANDDDEVEEAQVEEAKVGRVAKSPYAPTAQEREIHEATHLPYRSWCDICVSGRRDNPPHLARTPEERSIPEIGMDYCFVRRKVEEESTTVIVIKDRDSKAIRAHALKYKGTCLDGSSCYLRLRVSGEDSSEN